MTDTTIRWEGGYTSYEEMQDQSRLVFRFPLLPQTRLGVEYDYEWVLYTRRLERKAHLRYKYDKEDWIRGAKEMGLLVRY